MCQTPLTPRGVTGEPGLPPPLTAEMLSLSPQVCVLTPPDMRVQALFKLMRVDLDKPHAENVREAGAEFVKILTCC